MGKLRAPNPLGRRLPKGSPSIPDLHIDGLSEMSAPISLSKSEKSYIQTALSEHSPIRADGRSLLDYRSIALETGVASLSNGSARVNIGKTAGEESGSGTEVIAAVKLEVENVLEGEGVDGGRIACTVSWFVSDFFLLFFCLAF